MSARRALVTGGAGFIGSHLVTLLVQEGWCVRVLDDFSSGRRENLTSVSESIEIAEADICDAPALRDASQDMDTIFHLAAIPSVPLSLDDPIHTHNVNAEGTLQVLEAARDAKLKRVVFAASCAAYGDGPELPKTEDLAPAPASPYALQKYMGEVYARQFYELFGLETVALRYFNVFGPRQNPESEYAAAVPRFAKALLNGQAPRIYGDGEQTRDFVYVGDVARATLQAASAEAAAGKMVNIGSGLETSVNDLVAMLRETTGSTLEPVHEAARAGDVRHSVADLSQAKAYLGYAPEVSLADGLRFTVDDLRKRQEGQAA